MTALEKAARAIHDAPWETLSQYQQLAAIRTAKAVLMAVREPDAEMLAAGGFVETGSANHFMSSEIWTEMIDAILAETPA